MNKPKLARPNHRRLYRLLGRAHLNLRNSAYPDLAATKRRLRKLYIIDEYLRGFKSARRVCNIYGLAHETLETLSTVRIASELTGVRVQKLP